MHPFNCPYQDTPGAGGHISPCTPFAQLLFYFKKQKQNNE